MKPITLLSTVVALLISFTGINATDKDNVKLPSSSLKEVDLPFVCGEKLTYSVHYKWGLVNADVATATMKLDTTSIRGDRVFHATLTGATKNFYESLFKVDENLQSWFTTDDLKPMKFTRTAVEGKYTCRNYYRYDWTAGKEQIIATLYSSRKGDYSAYLKLNEAVKDVPTMLYLLRCFKVKDLKTNVRYPLTFAIDDDIYDLHFVYLGKETKTISGLGDVKCLKFGLQVVSGDVFSGDSDLYCWLSDDENRIPVFFMAPLKMGKVQGRLTDSSNLKHPFNSIVK